MPHCRPLFHFGAAARIVPDPWRRRDPGGGTAVRESPEVVAAPFRSRRRARCRSRRTIPRRRSSRTIPRRRSSRTIRPSAGAHDVLPLELVARPGDSLAGSCPVVACFRRIRRFPRRRSSRTIRHPRRSLGPARLRPSRLRPGPRDMRRRRRQIVRNRLRLLRNFSL